MAAPSSIEWTHATWNPVTGCTKVSEGCRHCYAERLAHRLHAMGNPNYVNAFEVTLHPRMLDVPLHWMKPRLVFVNSMSDLFHPDVPVEYIGRVFDVMSECQRHTFQILTKRPERLVEVASLFAWPTNVWMGVTVENEECAPRIDYLLTVPAHTKFVSFEPLLGAISPRSLAGIDWVIVGGESGPGARPMHREWVLDIRSECRRQGIPFFFKQWGGTNKKKAGRLLDGKTWDGMPESAVRLRDQVTVQKS